MLPWLKATTEAVRENRETRITVGRQASDLEALMEVQYLMMSGGWDSQGFAWHARMLGWSRGKLGRALDRWRDAGRLHHEGDGQIADTLANTSANSMESDAKGIVEPRRTADGQLTDSKKTADGPPRASPLREKEEDVHPDLGLLYEAWRAYHPGTAKVCGKTSKPYLNARLKESGTETCLLVVEWAHTSGCWFQQHGKTAISTLFKATRWDQRVMDAQKWKAGGARKGASNPGELQREAVRWWSGIERLAKGDPYAFPRDAQQLAARLGHEGPISERTAKAWEALVAVGKCSGIARCNEEYDLPRKRAAFIAHYQGQGVQ